MNEYSFWSILPPIIAIALALRTKQVFLSLGLGIWIGWLIVDRGNPLSATMDTLAATVTVFEDAGNTRTIIFTLLVGSLIALIQRSGGVQGFILFLSRRLEGTNSRSRIQFYASLTGLILFVESNISILTVGTLYRPMFDKLKISREKLAYLADSSSAPSCILIPFNAWGAFIMSLLALQDFDDPFAVLARSMPYNFYPMLAIAFLVWIVFSGKDYSLMKIAESRAIEQGKLIADHATPMISDEIAELEIKEGIQPRMINMLIPLLTMVITMPLLLVYTGWNSIEDVSADFGTKVFEAIGHGSGSAAVLYAVSTAIAIAFILYRVQAIMKVNELVDLTLKGMSGMVSLALLMVFAFALGSLCKQLGTGIYIADISKAWLSPTLVPAIVFLVSCFIAFSTGTSWGTFAIMISIAVPMAEQMDLNVSIAIAAALGGGVFGDHCSPISDTTIISSMASASDHIDHVKTQLPYALIAGGGALVLYLILGLFV